jgi:hypothetical protein
MAGPPGPGRRPPENRKNRPAEAVLHRPDGGRMDGYALRTVIRLALASGRLAMITVRMPSL